MAKGKPTVQLRRPPAVDADRFVADVQEHTTTQAHERTATPAQARKPSPAPKSARAPKARAAVAVVERARLHCLIPGELHQWLGVQSVMEKRDMGEIVTDALARYRASKP